ncbi:MAG TPA: PilZ domain-containing protein [Nitrospira sp.]
MTDFNAQGSHIIERRKHRRCVLPPGSLLSFSPVVSQPDNAAEHEGEATVLDLSQGGCRIGSEIDLALERPYSLIIQLPYYPNPVTVESAIARWAGTQTFGVMFIAIQREQEQYLEEFLEYLRDAA